MKHDIFGAEVKAADGSRLAIVGLCTPGAARLCRERAQTLGALDFCDADYIEIDRRLAGGLQAAYPRDVVAVGATVRVERPNALPRTGGVLGSPTQEAASSSGELELLEGGYLLHTRPGGPGFVAAIDWATAEGIIRELDRNPQPGAACAQWLIKAFEAAGTGTYLIICDGSGGGQGVAAAAQGDLRLHYTL